MRACVSRGGAERRTDGSLWYLLIGLASNLSRPFLLSGYQCRNVLQTDSNKGTKANDDVLALSKLRLRSLAGTALSVDCFVV